MTAKTVIINIVARLEIEISIYLISATEEVDLVGNDVILLPTDNVTSGQIANVFYDTVFLQIR